MSALAAGGAGVALVAGALGAPASAAPARAAFSAVQTWTHEVPGVIALSSPSPVTIGAKPSVVVGARNGHLYAYNLAGGATAAGWGDVVVPGALPVDATPSVNGTLIYVGVGNAARPTGGGYLALHANGTRAWFRQVSRLPGGAGGASSVQASMTVGVLNHANSVAAGSLGQLSDAFRSSDGAGRPGFPWFSSDTEFATPAIANLYGNGTDFLVEGAEQTAGVSYGHRYRQGGHLRILRPTGNAGTGTPGGGLVCDFTPDQGVYSSPAVGRFLAHDAVGITFGTSTDFPGASDTDVLFAVGTHCGLAWRDDLNGATLSSPALIDALGDNQLQVAEGTENGVVYLINGSTGRPYWSRGLGHAVIGSITSADLGAGHQDLLVPTTAGLFILDGRSGAVVDRLGAGTVGMQNSALVTHDPDGDIGITLAGYNSHGGIVTHFDLHGTDGARADEPGAWPMFHHDAHLSGSTLPRGVR